jgi:hypothetical protein
MEGLVEVLSARRRWIQLEGSTPGGCRKVQSRTASSRDVDCIRIPEDMKLRFEVSRSAYRLRFPAFQTT